MRRVEDATEAAGGGGDGDAPPILEVARRHVSVELEGKGRVAALEQTEAEEVPRSPTCTEQ